MITSVPRIMIICYTVPEIQHVAEEILIFHFGLFFCPFTSLTTQKLFSDTLYLGYSLPRGIFLLSILTCLLTELKVNT